MEQLGRDWNGGQRRKAQTQSTSGTYICAICAHASDACDKHREQLIYLDKLLRRRYVENACKQNLLTTRDGTNYGRLSYINRNDWSNACLSKKYLDRKLYRASIKSAIPLLMDRRPVFVINDGEFTRMTRTSFRQDPMMSRERIKIKKTENILTDLVYCVGVRVKIVFCLIQGFQIVL
ncbi:unnamed protein product [Leptosia nina]|uniref:Uncharacterized protein n=1 Tax=Leptosia nina TaxID=320188 RepID=A0AAV1JGA6_9NEOP